MRLTSSFRWLNLLMLLTGSVVECSLNAKKYQRVSPKQDTQINLNQTDVRINLRRDGVNLSSKSSWLEVSRASGGLLLIRSKLNLNQSNPLDSNISRLLQLQHPDLRTSRDIADPERISLELSMRAWELLHERVMQGVQSKIALVRPALEELLEESAVSWACNQSIGHLLTRAGQLDSWAIRILNSWPSFPPAELLEGTYSQLGAYQSCTSVEEPSIGHAHYCSLTLKPIMPSKPQFELMTKPAPAPLRAQFERARPADIFSEYLSSAHYHHYLYFKLGTCWPISCSPFDVRKVVRTLARRNLLAYGPVKCYSTHEDDYEAVSGSGELAKEGNRSLAENETSSLEVSVFDKNDGIYVWKPHLYLAHIVAYAVLISLTLFIFTMTTIDVALNRLPSLYALYRKSRRVNARRSDQKPNNNIQTNGTHIETILNNETSNGNSLGGQKQIISSLFLEASDGFRPVNLNEEPATRRKIPGKKQSARERRQQMSTFMGLVDDCSMVTNTISFFRVGERNSKSEILCLNGLRSLTMLWVVTAHSMMYNDWSGFARTKEVERSITSILTQPIFNGTYVVDTFFLMSGLLSAFTAFRHSGGKAARFSPIGLLASRWLRLTPQLLLISLMYVVLPTISGGGPHWYPVVGEFSENCIDNWWVNVLHIQAFYRKDRMCNFVTWWISIDYFYHFLAIALIWISLRQRHLVSFLSLLLVLGASVAFEGTRHYQMALPPNFLSTLPQTGLIWTQFVLAFFWEPHAHAVPFFFGFYAGYLLALRRRFVQRKFTAGRALAGWAIVLTALPATSFSTRGWLIGAYDWSRVQSTAFYVTTPIVWSACLTYVIIACHLGYGGPINKILSWKVFIIGGKASYLIYLSHFLILLYFFGSQNVLLEPSEIGMLYVVMGNLILSTILGVLLCILYEIPWLKIQSSLVRRFTVGDR